MSKGAFNTTFMTGDEYKAWLASGGDAPAPDGQGGLPRE